MNENGGKPVAATRRNVPKPSGGGESGLLINVIRTLTSSVSEDQRELEKARLEKGFKDSGALIDRLVKNHQTDVEKCLDSFRDVSAGISNCRERMHNVRNALQTCSSLLELRRDDLKKLWMENAQQKHICDILAQLEELKDAPKKIDALVLRGSYQEAAKIVTNSRATLNGRLSVIEGLSQLRIQIEKSTSVLIEKINELIVSMIVVEPFEQHLFNIVRSLPEQKALQNEYCSILLDHSKQPPPAESLKDRLKNAVRALSELEEGHWDIDRLILLCKNSIDRQVAHSVTVMRVRGNIDENLAGDESHLSQLIQMVVAQLETSCSKHVLFAQIMEEFIPNKRIIPAYWDAAQAAVEALVSDHLDVNPLLSTTKQTSMNTKKPLFRFDATACASATSVVSSTSQNLVVVCKPSAYNIVVMFPWLSRLMESIEKQLDESPCQLRRFLHSFVMEMFVERVKASLAERIEVALRSSSGDTKILPSCLKVFELCKEVHGLIVSMDVYADRFAALWLLLLTDYYKSMSDMFDAMTPPPADADGTSVRRMKLSATWAADDDISRLLMSLPNWAAASASPLTPVAESEMDVRDRNKRESEILISNLGTQTQNKMKFSQLITEMSDVRAFAALHESLRWFSDQIKSLVESLPQHVRTALSGCMVQVRLKDGQIMDNESVIDAIGECVKRLETISDSCLLILHIELRVHCFFHLLPLAKHRNTSAHDEVDPEVVTLSRDLQDFHNVLKEVLSQSKLRYVFDGLGHLCAAIFIHLSQYMPRLTEPGKKRVCRNVWGLQQRLSQMTARREAELDRARAFFDLLLTYDPDSLLNVITDKKSMFSPIELSHLLALAVRSDPTLASQHGALEQRQLQLNAILKRSAS
ncbi:unnamed protein product [Caenorhabditis auriculariae]|uniref:Exocyst complex component Sec8 n=1 Tax=Caenorhabditis auriculariae TaxID=2777116 RepID=A0A8S1H363_9PELO|nr:unnamed protein product [Caenorhabditis auriculariae]